MGGRPIERARRLRTRGGTRTNVLTDFFIGAPASVRGAPILARDLGRYRTYFPEVERVAPERIVAPLIMS